MTLTVCKDMTGKKQVTVVNAKPLRYFEGASYISFWKPQAAAGKFFVDSKFFHGFYEIFSR